MNELFNNTKIRVTPEKSKRVQELAFENGLAWVDGGTLALNGSEEFLIFYAGKTVTCCTTEKYFKSHPYREITFSDLFPEKKEDANDLSSWSDEKLWARIQFIEYVIDEDVFDGGDDGYHRLNNLSIDYRTELLKRIESGTK